MLSLTFLALPLVVLAKPFRHAPRQASYPDPAQGYPAASYGPAPGYGAPPYGQPQPRPTYPGPLPATTTTPIYVSTTTTRSSAASTTTTTSANFATTTIYELGVTAAVTATISGTVVITLSPTLTTTTVYDPSITAGMTSTQYVPGQPTGTVIVTNPGIYVTTTVYDSAPPSTQNFPVTITRTTFNPGPPVTTGVIEVDVPVRYTTSLVYDPTLTSATTSTIYTSGQPTGTIIVLGPAIYTTTTNFNPTITQATTTTLTSFSPGPPVTTGVVSVDRTVSFSTSSVFDPSVTVPSTSTQYTSGQPTGIIVVTSQALYSTTTAYNPSMTTPSSTTLTSFAPGPPVTTGLVEVDQPVSFSTSLVYDPSITTPVTSTQYTSGQSTGVIVVTDAALYSTTTFFNPSITAPSSTTLTSFAPGPPVTTGLVELDEPVSFTTSILYDPSIVTPITSTVYTPGQSTGVIVVQSAAIYTTTTVYNPSITAPSSTTLTTFEPGPPVTTGTVELDQTVSFTTSFVYDPNNVAPITVTDYTSGESTGTLVITDKALYTTTTSYGTEFTASSSTTLTSFNPGPPVTTGVVEVDQPVTYTTSFVYDPTVTAPSTTTIYTGGSGGTIVVTSQAVYTTTTVYGTSFVGTSSTILTTFEPGPPITTGVVELDVPVSFTTTTVYSSDVAQPVTNTVYVGGPSGTVSITSLAVYTTTTVYDTAIQVPTTTVLTSFNPGPPVTTGTVEVDQTVSFTTTTVYDPNNVNPITTTVYTGGPSGIVTVTDNAAYTTSTRYGTEFVVPSSTTIVSFNPGPPVTTGIVELDTSPMYSTTTVYVNNPALTAPITSTDYTAGQSTAIVSVTLEGIYSTITNYDTQFIGTTFNTVSTFDPGPPVTTGLIEVDQPPRLTTTIIYTNNPAYQIPSSTTEYTAGDPTGVVSVTANGIYSTVTSYGTQYTDPAATRIVSMYTSGPPETTGLVEVDSKPVLATTTVYTNDPAYSLASSRTDYVAGASTGVVSVTAAGQYSTTTLFGTQYPAIPTSSVLTMYDAGPPVTTGLVEVDQRPSLATTTIFTDDPAFNVPSSTTNYVAGASTGVVSVTAAGQYITTTVYGTQYATTPVSRIVTMYDVGPPQTIGVVEVDQRPALVTTTIYTSDPAVTAPVSNTDYTAGESTGIVSVTAAGAYTTTTSYGLQFTNPPSTSLITPYNPGPPVTTGTFEVDQQPALSTSFIYTNDPNYAAASSITNYVDGQSTGQVFVTAFGTYNTVTSYALTFVGTNTVTATQYNPGPPITTGVIEIDQPPTFTTTSTFTNVAVTTSTTVYNSGDPTATVINQTPLYTTSTVYGVSAGSSTRVTGNPTQQGTVIVTSAASNVIQPTVVAGPATTGNQPIVSPTLPTPSTAQQVPPFPTQCGNQGLAWAEYNNRNGGYNSPVYSNFIPEQYKGTLPNFSGQTGSVGGFSYRPRAQGTITIYQQYTVRSDYWVLNHQGYIYPPRSGLYTFTTYQADEIVIVWLGNKAYSGWTRGNANLVQAYAPPLVPNTGDYPGEAPVSFTVQLNAGTYYPLRIVYANAQGSAEFHLYITDPDGKEFLGPQTTESPYVVQYSCDRTTAPPFPEFGDQS